MASLSVPCPKCPSPSILGLKSNKILFGSGLSLKHSQSFGSLSAESASFGIKCLNRKQFPLKTQAQRNEVSSLPVSFFSLLRGGLVTAYEALTQTQTPAAAVENSKSVPVPVNGPTVAAIKEKENQNGNVSGDSVEDASSVSAFMTQVADLVKLVDSRDIVELQLKQSDCELLIRKTEALQPPPAAAMPQQPLYYQTLPSPPPPAPAAASAPAGSPPPSKATPALPPPKRSASSHPQLKCPMAGTFYRCPGPGEPPFVKVGDKVQKGQVVCIIEAMKLMNEIEADQSGTITEILVEDGKPVSIDLPLFVIAP
ncbi:biotin carboxyl carrier protein of acetyl-CoA carboxylase 2, chloroplastic isoform X1 [Cicer arietinum]|uniref:Biotin carboxyl carrier protein of acetyl-CoA carboxylase n=1 Tax=Cicer arietinum TaxID=3827 RepID=A0A1S2XJB0_CICAR|nr:biotin carboxyl carrier protein of acetyl-CoA carboxylase 1, chloroplastic isoform X1 [Cicer arietinum]